MKKLIFSLLFLGIVLGFSQTVTYSGNMNAYQCISVLAEDDVSWYESGVGSNNPFTERFFEVRFRHLGTGNYNKDFYVPGFWSADGNSAYSNATSGKVWKAYFIPKYAGQYEVTLNFRQGTDVNRSVNPNSFPPDNTLHGWTDTITIGGWLGSGWISNGNYRGNGFMEYYGDIYPKFNGTSGWPWYSIMFTANGPENFLAYDFGGTESYDGISDNYIKDWSAHWQDTSVFQPTWSGPPETNGSGLFGAVNYLSQRINTINMLLFSAHGDDKNVFPYVFYPSCVEGQDDQKKQHFDVSKIEKWAVLWQYMDDHDMGLDAMLMETENDRCFSVGDRILYYRTMCAILSSKLVTRLNFGEENNWINEYPNGSGVDSLEKWIQFLSDTYPYDGGRIALHTYPSLSNQQQTYNPMLGFPFLNSASLQIGNINNAHNEVKHWVEQSKAAGQPWIVTADENGPWGVGTPMDPTYPGAVSTNPNINDIRIEWIWGSLFAQAGGVGIYPGWTSYPQNDLTMDDYRSRDTIWAFMKKAQVYFNNFPYWACYQADTIMGDNDDYALAMDPYNIAFYLSDGGDLLAKLPNDPNALWELSWYDPITGQFQTYPSFVQGTYPINSNGFTVIPNPTNNTKDWAGFLVSYNTSPMPVNFVNIDGELTEWGSRIWWEVAEQENIKFYEIWYQPENSSEMVFLDRVQAHGGNHYTYDHFEPFSGMVFYQVVGVDRGSGDRYYSNLLQLLGDKSRTKLAIVAKRTVIIPNRPYKLINQMGQVVDEYSDLPTGIYYIIMPEIGYSKSIYVR